MQASIGMPCACASCRNYQHQGFADDEHCPFQGAFASSPKPRRTPFGICEHDDSLVFATEICSGYLAEPGVDPIPVTNRPEPMQPHQERLDLEVINATPL